MSARSESAPARDRVPAVDASMRLLREVMEQPLDPAYARAAELRGAGARPGVLSVVLTVVVAVLCGWITVRGVVELRRPEPGQAAGRATLEREIERRTAAADARQQEIQRLRAQIAAAQQAELTSQGDTALAAQVQQLSLLTGEQAVSGPGLEITLQDSPQAAAQGAAVDPRSTSPAAQGRVIDRDLQIVVNGLWAAGAEAIAINGRRLTTLSAIRSAGEAILVDFRPLIPPYRVQAIGNASSMQTQFSSLLAGTYLQSLQNNLGVQVSITSAGDLRLPPAGAFQLRQAGVASTATASSTPSPSTTHRSTAPAGRASSSGTQSPTEVTP